MQTWERLSPHRIALRAFLRAPTGGVMVGVLFIIMVAFEGASMSEVPMIGASVAAGSAMYCGLLVFAVEVSAYARTKLRYILPLLLSGILIFAISAGGIWVIALAEGRGMEWALNQFLEVTKEFVREPEVLIGASLGLTLPFFAASTAQLAMRVGALPVSRMLVVGLVAVAGVVSFFGICISQSEFPNDMTQIMLVCAGAPAAAIFGMQLGGRLEARLVRAWQARARASD